MEVEISIKLHPRKQTNDPMEETTICMMYLLFKRVVFHCHVKFRVYPNSKETEEGSIFHWTMIVGGRVTQLSSYSRCLDALVES